MTFSETLEAYLQARDKAQNARLYKTIQAQAAIMAEAAKNMDDAVDAFGKGLIEHDEAIKALQTQPQTIEVLDPCPDQD